MRVRYLSSYLGTWPIFIKINIPNKDMFSMKVLYFPKKAEAILNGETVPNQAVSTKLLITFLFVGRYIY